MSKPTGWVPGVRYSGYTGQVLVDDLNVTISREGFGGRLTGVELRRLTRDEVKVEHRPATRLRNGWVRLTDSTSGPRPRLEYQDPDLVLYTWQQREAFGDLLDRLTRPPGSSAH